jgi:16S rRNA C1402 N4-methylase RsmH
LYEKLKPLPLPLAQIEESKVVAFDRDPVAIERAKQIQGNLTLINAPFSKMNHSADAALFDLGLSSDQVKIGRQLICLDK